MLRRARSLPACGERSAHALRRLRGIISGLRASRVPLIRLAALAARHLLPASGEKERERGPWHEPDRRAADPVARSRDRAVLARTARMAERLLRRARLARRRGCHRTFPRAERRADGGRHG